MSMDPGANGKESTPDQAPTMEAIPWVTLRKVNAVTKEPSVVVHLLINIASLQETIEACKKEGRYSFLVPNDLKIVFPNDQILLEFYDPTNKAVADTAYSKVVAKIKEQEQRKIIKPPGMG